ncbi:MAG: hypothetical protein P9M08_13100 [Candidatus Erginobacter occultus]|nr:hypothetical protein [Candidatus Erginobacter occultus]
MSAVRIGPGASEVFCFRGPKSAVAATSSQKKAAAPRAKEGRKKKSSARY